MKKIGQMKAEAREKLTGFYLLSAGINIIGALLISASTAIVVGPLLLAGVFDFGYSTHYLTVARNQEKDFSNLFAGFNRFGETCLTGVLHRIFLGLWALVFVIPAFVKSYSYAMTFYILHDNPTMSSLDAITESRRLMDGHKWQLFVLDLSFIGWILLSILTFGILYLLKVGPDINAAHAQFYLELLANQAPIAPQQISAPQNPNPTENPAE